MKILYLGNEDMRKEGAGKTHFFEVANNFQKLNHEVTILLPGYFPIKRDKTTLKVVYIPTLEKSIISYLIYEFLKVFYIIWYLIVLRYEVVYSRSALLDFMPGIISLLTKSRYFTERNGIAESEMRMNGVSEFKIRVIKLAEKINCKLSHGIICVTQGIADYYSSEYKVSPKKMHVVTNGTNVEKFQILEQEICRKGIGVENSTFIVGFVGTFAKWQYLELLIESARIIKMRGVTNIRYMLVGDGSEYENIINKIKKYDLVNEFILTGKVLHEEIPKYIGAFDICYLCKYGLEGGFSPLKMYEYLACGKPVVANRIDGIEEFVNKNNCGVLFDSANIEELADRILYSVQNLDEMKIRGRNGRDVVEKEHSWKSVTLKLEKILRNKTI